MYKLENMQELSLKGNKLNLFPEYLLTWPNIEYTEWLGLGNFYNRKILKNYFSVRNKYIKKGWEDRNDWLAAFYLLTNQPKELAKLDRKNLLKTLFIKQSLIDAAALDYIKKTSNNLIKKPLTESSSVAVLGKLKELSEEGLIKCFEDKNIAYTFKIIEKTTHVLLNIPLKTTHLSTIDLLDNLVIINEGSIKDLQNSSNKNLYLLDKTEDSKENLEKIKSLLFSRLDADKWIAVELMKAGGYPKTFINEIFIAHQTAQDMKLRSAIESHANVYLSPKAKTALKHFGFKEGMSDHKLWTRFKKHIIPNPEFDGAYIAQILYERFKLGHNFILRATSSENIKAFFEKNITNNVLDFSGHDELAPLPNEVNEFKNLEKIILHNCSIKNFPKALLENKLPLLKEIDFGDSHPPIGVKNAEKLLKSSSIIYKEWL
jgi:hypothetical protein